MDHGSLVYIEEFVFTEFLEVLYADRIFSHSALKLESDCKNNDLETNASVLEANLPQILRKRGIA